MLTERQKRMIESYLPSPRDQSLEEGEYYVLYYGRSREYVRKVRIANIFPITEGWSSYTEYDVYDVKSGARVDSGWGSRFRGFRMHALYDNKEDCRNQTHIMYDDWEQLRKLQEAENNENIHK